VGFPNAPPFIPTPALPLNDRFRDSAQKILGSISEASAAIAEKSTTLRTRVFNCMQQSSSSAIREATSAVGRRTVRYPIRGSKSRQWVLYISISVTAKLS